jgi:hypothetical protein
MRLKHALLALPLSLVALAPRLCMADTLTFTGTGGTIVDDTVIYPYDFTVTGPGGTNTNVAMICLNFNREITPNEMWNVTAVNVASITSNVDGETETDYRADAWLTNQLGTSAGSLAEIQFAIWDIMDPSGIGPLDGFDATAQSLAAQALSNATTLPTSYFGNDVAYVPTGDTTGWTDGQPQIFMVNAPQPPSAITPEPSSLLLFGTGLLGTVAIMRRRLQMQPQHAAKR